MEATFIIVREDLQVDPVTIVAEGVLIGRLPTCELLLNHPSVSRLHAGITYADGNYYLRNLRPGNPIMVNGAKLEEYDALADGDVVGIGPFALNIGFAQGWLVVKVSLQIAASPADAMARRDVSGVWDLPTTAKLEILNETMPGGVEGAAHHRKVPPRKAKAGEASSRGWAVFGNRGITGGRRRCRQCCV